MVFVQQKIAKRHKSTQFEKKLFIRMFYNCNE